MTFYFDNSSTTLIKPPEVAEAVFQSIQSQTIGNPSRGSHSSAVHALRQIEKTRIKVAALFHVSNASQVSFTPNATYALNLLLRSILSTGDAVITTMQEHNSVLRPLYQLEKQGVSLAFIPLDEEGVLRLDTLNSLLCPHTKAVIINHMSNVTGKIANLKEIGEFCRKHQLLLLVDAAQSAGTVPIHMDKLQIDALCFTGHKGLYGPQGTGGICLGDSFSRKHMHAVFSGGSGSHSFQHEMPSEMPGIFEMGTQNVHGLAGLEAGVEYVPNKGTNVIQKQMQKITQLFVTSLQSIPGVEFYGIDEDMLKLHPECHGGIVSLNLSGWESGDLADVLSQDYDISVRSGAHCAPLIHEHFGTVERGMVRFSFSSFTTEEEVLYAANTLREIACSE